MVGSSHATAFGTTADGDREVPENLGMYAVDGGLNEARTKTERFLCFFKRLLKIVLVSLKSTVIG